MVLFLVLVFLFPGDMKLVLNNGKHLACDSYEVKGGRVWVHRSGSTFTLPLSSVNLKKSGPVDHPEKKEEKPVTLVKKPASKRRDPITLNTSDLKINTGNTGKTETSFKKVGNSILVEITINGSGPFSIILDTGASTTVIDPYILNNLNALQDSHEVPMVGLSGQTVMGLDCLLHSIALAGQEIKDFRVVSYSIPQIREIGAVGLLGQDFMNYFVVNLDSSNNRLTLTPHGREMGPTTIERHEDVREKLEAWRTSVERLDLMTTSTISIWNQAMRGMVRELEFRRSSARELKQYSREMGGIRRNADHLNQSLSALDSLEIQPEYRGDVERFMACYPDFYRYLEDFQRFCGVLRIYLEQPDDTRMNRQKESLLMKYENLRTCREKQ